MIRIVDLFCGIGGVAEAAMSLPMPSGTQDASRPFRVVAAIDIDERIKDIYANNHGITPDIRAIESLRSVPDDITALDQRIVAALRQMAP